MVDARPLRSIPGPRGLTPRRPVRRLDSCGVKYTAHRRQGRGQGSKGCPGHGHKTQICLYSENSLLFDSGCTQYAFYTYDAG